jgi:hypothetical protein
MGIGRRGVLACSVALALSGLAGGCSSPYSGDEVEVALAGESVDDVVGCRELSTDLQYVDHGDGARQLGVDLFGAYDDELTDGETERIHRAAARRGWDRRALDVLMGPSVAPQLATWLDISPADASSELRRVEASLAKAPVCVPS